MDLFSILDMGGIDLLLSRDLGSEIKKGLDA